MPNGKPKPIDSFHNALNRINLFNNLPDTGNLLLEQLSGNASGALKFYNAVKNSGKFANFPDTFEGFQSVIGIGIAKFNKEQGTVEPTDNLGFFEKTEELLALEDKLDKEHEESIRISDADKLPKAATALGVESLSVDVIAKRRAEIGESAIELPDQKEQVITPGGIRLHDDRGVRKSRNPLYSFKQSVWATLSADLPSTFKATQAELAGVLAAGQKKPDLLTPSEAFDQNFVNDENVDRFIVSEEELIQRKANIPDTEIEKFQKQAMQSALEFEERGIELREDLITSLFKDVRDPLDFLNWFATVVGQTGAQIPLAVATFGLSSATMEIGTIYLDEVRRISEKTGLTPIEVIDQGLDRNGVAIAYGLVAAALDLIGAKKVVSGLKPSTFAKMMRIKAVPMLEKFKVEAITEGSQDILEQVGAMQGASPEGLLSSLGKVEVESIIESAMAGGFGASGVHGAGTIVRSIVDGRSNLRQNELREVLIDLEKKSMQFEDIQDSFAENEEVLPEVQVPEEEALIDDYENEARIIAEQIQGEEIKSEKGTIISRLEALDEAIRKDDLKEQAEIGKEEAIEAKEFQKEQRQEEAGLKRLGKRVEEQKKAEEKQKDKKVTVQKGEVKEVPVKEPAKVVEEVTKVEKKEVKEEKVTPKKPLGRPKVEKTVEQIETEEKAVIKDTEAKLETRISTIENDTSPPRKIERLGKVREEAEKLGLEPTVKRVDRILASIEAAEETKKEKATRKSKTPEDRLEELKTVRSEESKEEVDFVAQIDKDVEKAIKEENFEALLIAEDEFKEHKVVKAIASEDVRTLSLVNRDVAKKIEEGKKLDVFKGAKEEIQQEKRKIKEKKVSDRKKSRDEKIELATAVRRGDITLDQAVDKLIAFRKKEGLREVSREQLEERLQTEEIQKASTKKSEEIAKKKKKEQKTIEPTKASMEQFMEDAKLSDEEIQEFKDLDVDDSDITFGEKKIQGGKVRKLLTDTYSYAEIKTVDGINNILSAIGMEAVNDNISQKIDVINKKLFDKINFLRKTAGLNPIQIRITEDLRDSNGDQVQGVSITAGKSAIILIDSDQQFQGVAQMVVSHELLHPLTSLLAGESSKLKGRAAKIFNVALVDIHRDAFNAIDKILSKPESLRDQQLNDALKLYEKVVLGGKKKITSPLDIYGMTSTQEVISELANPYFANILNSIESGVVLKEKQTLLTRLVKSFMEFLNRVGVISKISEKSLLAKSIRIVDDFTDALANNLDISQESQAAIDIRARKVEKAPKNQRVQNIVDRIRNLPRLDTKKSIIEFINRINEALPERIRFTETEIARIVRITRAEQSDIESQSRVNRMIRATDPKNFTKKRGAITEGKKVDAETIKRLTRIHVALKGDPKEAEVATHELLNKEAMEGILDEDRQKHEERKLLLQFQQASEMSPIQQIKLARQIEEIIKTGRTIREAKLEKVREERRKVRTESLRTIIGMDQLESFDIGKLYKEGTNVLYKNNIYTAKSDLIVNTVPTNIRIWKKQRLIPVKGTKEFEKSKGNPFLGDFLVNAESFHSMLDLISQKDVKTAPLQSFLNKQFGGSVRMAEENEIKGKEFWVKKATDKFVSIFAGNRSGDQKQKAIKLAVVEQQKLDKEFTYADDNTGENITIPLSDAQIYKKWMEFQDETLDNTWKSMGVSKSLKPQIEAYMDKNPELKEWALWQLNEFYPAYYESVNKVFKDHYGVDLLKIDKYSPVLRDIGGKELTDISGVLLAFEHPVASLLTSSLKTRRSNINAIKYTDGNAILFGHIFKNEHFKAWDGTVTELRSTFNTGIIRESIRFFHGEPMQRAIDEYMKDFARGGIYQEMSTNFYDKLRSYFATSVLGANLSLFFKQLASSVSTIAEIGFGPYFEGLANFAANPIEARKILMDTPFMRDRLKSGHERDVAVASLQSAGQILSGARSFRDQMMALVRLGDSGAIIAGGWPVYIHFRDIARKEGKSTEEAHKIGIRKFTEISLSSQQSSRISDLSRLQLSSWGKFFTMFQTAQMQYFRHTRAAYRGLVKGRGNVGDNLRKLFVYHALLPLMFQYVAQGLKLRDEDDELDDVLLTRLFTLGVGVGSLNGVPIFGKFMEHAAHAVAGDQINLTLTPLTGIGTNAVDMFLRFSKLLFEIQSGEVDDFTPDDIDDALAILDSPLTHNILFVAGIATGLPFNPAVKQAMGIGAALQGKDDFRRALGYSEYALNTREGKKVTVRKGPRQMPRQKGQRKQSRRRSR